MKYDRLAKKLKGQELWEYLTEWLPKRSEKDSDYASIVKLLFFACGNLQKTYSILEDMVQNDKELFAIYPGLGEEPSEGMKWIGEIYDGGLYIK